MYFFTPCIVILSYNINHQMSFCWFILYEYVTELGCVLLIIFKWIVMRSDEGILYAYYQLCDCRKTDPLRGMMANE